MKNEYIERKKFLKIHKTDPKYLDENGVFINEDAIIQAYLDYEEAFHEYYNNKKKENIEMKKNSKDYYNLRKAQLVEEAMEYQDSCVDYEYSYGELYEIGNYFMKMAKRYGLVREFRENGII